MNYLYTSLHDIVSRNTVIIKKDVGTSNLACDKYYCYRLTLFALAEHILRKYHIT